MPEKKQSLINHAIVASVERRTKMLQCFKIDDDTANENGL
jgi:hypothetical protein